MPLELQKVLDWFRFPLGALQEAGLTEADLHKIYDAHCAKTEELKKAGDSIVSRLREIKQVIHLATGQKTRKA